MLARLLKPLGFEFRRLDRDGKIEEYRLIVRKSDNMELTIVPTVVDGLPIRFAVNFRDDMIQRHHFRGEFYERDELEKIRRYFRGGVFVDVGANVGNHAIFAAKFLGAEKVIAFEPGALAATILKCNVALNDLCSIVEVREVALSDGPGTARFENSNPYNLGMARIDIDKAGDTPLVRGDDVLGRADFIKIDTEGLEIRVLTGLTETLRKNRPPVFVEVHDQNAQAAEELFSKAGYSIEDKSPSYAGMANWIALPPSV